MVGSVIPFWLNKQSHGRKAIVSAWNKGPLNDLNKIKKGQELGYFQMGSTVILCFFQDPSNLIIISCPYLRM